MSDALNPSTITIAGERITIKPPPLELWEELNTLDTDVYADGVYPWGWAVKILASVLKHCAGRAFAGRADHLALLTLAIIHRWDTAYVNIASRKAFVRSAVAFYLAGTVRSFFRIHLALNPAPGLAPDADAAGAKHFVRGFTGLAEGEASADEAPDEPRPFHPLRFCMSPDRVPTEREVFQLVGLAIRLPWDKYGMKTARVPRSQILPPPAGAEVPLADEADAEEERPESPAPDYCLIPPNQARWEETTELPPQLYQLLKALLTHGTWPVPFDAVEGVVGDSGKNVSNAVSRLNLALEPTKFPWTFRTKSAHVTKD
jgi:hypothetical protein